MTERNLTRAFSLLIPKFGSFGKDTLAANPEFLFQLIHSAPVGLLATDERGVIILFNERAKHNLGVAENGSEWIGKPIFELTAFSNKFTDFAKDFLEGKRKPHDLLELDVEGRHLTIRGWSAKGGLMLALNDVTRLKRMEAANLSATIEGQENERSRLAREIHDGIGPLLSTLNLYLEALQPDLERCSDEAQQKYRNTRKLVNSLTREIRNISHALMPIAVEDFGLVAAIGDMVEKVSDSAHLKVHFYTSGMEDRLEHPVELGMYRIVQELLNNAIKYAKAKMVNIQLIRHKESVVLTYEDDGIGFDKNEPVQPKGYGLRDIQSRVKSLGGNFFLDATPGRGVVATVEIPV